MKSLLVSITVSLGLQFKFGKKDAAPRKMEECERALISEEGGGAYSQSQMTRIYMKPFQFLYTILCGINRQATSQITLGTRA